MAKKERQKGKGLGNKKWIIIVLLGLALIITTIVLIITYLPSDVKTVSDSIRMFNYSDSAIESFYNDYHAQANILTDNNKNELCGLYNVTTATNYIYTDITMTFNQTVSGKISRKEAKSMESNMSKSYQSLNKINNLYIERKDDLKDNSPAVVNATWESSRVYFREFLDANISYFQKLAKIYGDHELRGVYGNKLMIERVEAFSAYYQAIRDKFFLADKENQQVEQNILDGKNISEQFLNFAQKQSAHSAEDNVSNYYISSNIKASTEKICKLEESTDGKVNFYKILIENFNTQQFNLTSVQQANVNLVVKFLKGESLNA